MAKKVNDVVFRADMDELKIKRTVDSQDGLVHFSLAVPLKATVPAETRNAISDLMGLVEVTLQRVQAEFDV